jgi:hypothetical protein
MDNEQIRRNLIRILWVYELLVIGTCLYAGFNIAAAQGGSIPLASPLIMISSAEFLRIPLSAWSIRLSWPMRLLSGVVMLAIALASFEGLAITFELFLTNRIHDVRTIQRTVEVAQEAVDAKRQEAQQSQAAIDSARMKVTALNAEIKEKETHPPQQPNVSAGSCHNRSGRAVSCNSDIQARRDFTLAQKSHLETLKKLREQRDAGQANVDALTANIKPAGLLEAEKILKSKRQDLSDVLHQSPVYRLAASIFGVRVQDLSEEQFESFKRVAIIGLSGSFATLSMFVSFVAHAQPQTNRPSKIKLAIRSYLARKRRPLVRVYQVEVPGPERQIIRWLPYDYTAGHRLPEYELNKDETPKTVPFTIKAVQS